MDREEFFIQLILATSRGEKKILYGYPPILTAGGRVYDFCEYYGRFGEDSCNKWEGCKIENDKCVFADPYYWTYNAGNDQLVYIEPGTRTTITLDAISKNNPPLTSDVIYLTPPDIPDEICMKAIGQLQIEGNRCKFNIQIDPNSYSSARVCVGYDNFWCIREPDDKSYWKNLGKTHGLCGFVCEDGDERCISNDLYRCIDNNWELIELDSLSCPCDTGKKECRGFDLYECVNGQYKLIEYDSEQCKPETNNVLFSEPETDGLNYCSWFEKDVALHAPKVVGIVETDGTYETNIENLRNKAHMYSVGHGQCCVHTCKNKVVFISTSPYSCSIEFSGAVYKYTCFSSKNLDMFAGKTLHLMSCVTALNLGKDLVNDHGVIAFIGYDNLFVYGVWVSGNMPPPGAFPRDNSDVYTFMDSDIEAERNILIGKTIGESVDSIKAKFEEYIDLYTIGEWKDREIAQYAVLFLEHNLAHLVVLGDLSATPIYIEGYTTQLSVSLTNESGAPITSAYIGDTIYITGTLTVTETNEPLQNAEIYLVRNGVETTLKAITDANGIYSIPYTILETDYPSVTFKTRFKGA